jgi:uncharacterized membrane protein
MLKLYILQICTVLEIVLGCWSLDILSTTLYPEIEISSTKSKNKVIGVAIVLTLCARIIALIIWIRSTHNVGTLLFQYSLAWLDRIIVVFQLIYY